MRHDARTAAVRPSASARKSARCDAPPRVSYRARPESPRRGGPGHCLARLAGGGARRRARRRRCGAATGGRGGPVRGRGRLRTLQLARCMLQVGSTVEWNRPAAERGPCRGRGAARRLCRCNGRSKKADGGGVRRNDGDSERLCVLAIGRAAATYRFGLGYFDGGVAWGVATFLPIPFALEYLSSTPEVVVSG